MGVELYATKCDACGQTMTANLGPNWALVQGPDPGTTILYTCMNMDCGKVLGITYVPPR